MRRTMRPASVGVVTTAVATIGLALVAPLAACGQGLSEAARKQPTTHRQVATISLDTTGGSAKLKSFCVDAEGRVLAVVQRVTAADTAGGIIGYLFGGAQETAQPQGSELHVYDGAGKLLAAWKLDFAAQAVNVGPEGDVYIAGDGHIARYDGAGKLLAAAEAPQMERVRSDPEGLKRRAEEQLAAEKQQWKDALEQFNQQIAEFKKKDAQTLSDDEKLQLANAEQLQKAYEQMAKQTEERTLEQVIADLTTRARTINAVAADTADVYITCGASKGYGYAVWRTDRDFKGGKQIIDNLSGCCGQMDVQCCQGVLYVAENSRHHVARFDREGTLIGSFGKRDRDAVGEGFGGCCNPMNTRMTKDGALFVAEDDGQVKHFTPEGQFVGLVGIATVQPGCKSSAIGVSPDGSRVYYIDVHKSQIIVLARNDLAEQKTN